MKYFFDCKTLHEAKAKYRELAKKNHPDVGGDSKIMAEITKQYDEFTPNEPEHTNFFKNNFSDAYNKDYYNSYSSTYKSTYNSEDLEIRSLKDIISNLKHRLSMFSNENYDLSRRNDEMQEEIRKLKQQLATVPDNILKQSQDMNFLKKMFNSKKFKKVFENEKQS